MAVQTLVSASIAAETKEEILKSIAEIKGKLGFLLTLQTDEVSGIFKAGKEYTPFIDLCHSVAKSHPEILSGVFNVAEFDRDYQLSKDLGVIADAVHELNEAVDHTLTAARSDALVSSLDVYSASKLNRDRIPGLWGSVDAMAQYFKKSPKLATKAAK